MPDPRCESAAKACHALDPALGYTPAQAGRGGAPPYTRGAKARFYGCHIENGMALVGGSAKASDAEKGFLLSAAVSGAHRMRVR
jgi:hypothetical protein